MEKLKKHIHEEMNKAWDLMGDTGSANHLENARPEELIAFGKFLALERIDIVFLGDTWTDGS